MKFKLKVLQCQSGVVLIKAGYQMDGYQSGWLVIAFRCTVLEPEHHFAVETLNTSIPYLALYAIAEATFDTNFMAF